MPLQVLGVVRRGHPAPTSGRGESPLGVRMVDSGDLAAAVVDIDDEGTLDQQDAPVHLDLLILLLRDGPVLPLSFGTVAPDEHAVRAEVLDAAADDLLQRLDAVDGFVEARLDVFFDESTALREVLRTSPEVRALAGRYESRLDARVRAGEVVSLELMDWRRTQADALLSRLAEPVHSVAELSSSDPLQQRWAFLVAGDRLAELDRVVGELRSSLGEHAELEYVGPLPAYSFLEDTAPAEAPARSAWGW